MNGGQWSEFTLLVCKFYSFGTTDFVHPEVLTDAFAVFVVDIHRQWGRKR